MWDSGSRLWDAAKAIRRARETADETASVRDLTEMEAVARTNISALCMLVEKPVAAATSELLDSTLVALQDARACDKFSAVADDLEEARKIFAGESVSFETE